MTKFLKNALASAILVSFLATGCSGSPKLQKQEITQDTTKPAATRQNTGAAQPNPSPVKESPSPAPTLDLAKVKPNENGKIIVVMFHNFIETYTSGDKEYTTTFDEFRRLLQTLYEKGYRLINVNDYLNNDISVPAGCIPMIFTFDDGTSGQFNLVEENGVLTASKQSAVGIMEEFNKAHPDFGLKGTFYVNLGLKTFEGKGSIQERLNYLIAKGFEIGNHTYSHISLPKAKTAEEIRREVGGNQKKMSELIPGYEFKSLALPFGQSSKELQGFVVKGEYNGTKYENFAVMEVGAGPTVSPVSKKSTPLSMSRVRATGIKQVDADLDWWIKRLTREDQYISDGNPNTVTVPKAKEAEVDREKLKGKQLVTY